MSGTFEGGKKAARTNRERYGDDYYTLLGAKGGESSNTGGFASENAGVDGLTGRERAILAGRAGGRKRLENKMKSAPTE